jgi:pyruvate dehydrogenase E2 component (dihydrolipoamide acetyltransferase)
MTEIFTVDLPDIGEGVVEGEVIEWLKNVGDALEQDEPVVMVMTDKATVELPAPYPGTLSKQYFQPGEIAIKDKPLYDIEVAAGVKLKRKKRVVVEEVATVAATSPVATGGKALAAPATRRLAQELGIDISSVAGSGNGGIVTKVDVAKHGGSKPVSSTPITRFDDSLVTKVIGLRALIAERMSESRRLIPDFSYFATADATRLVQMRQRSKQRALEEEGIRLTYMPFFIRALSVALQEFPMFNSSYDPVKQEIYVHKQHNIGIAVKSRLGLLVPVLKGVQDMSLHEIIRAYDEIIKKANSHKLTAADMKDGTITISNFGAVGGVWATPIINHPEVCILGLGRIEKRPVVFKGEVVIREQVNLSWSGDHRVIDGDQCASLSNHFSQLLENPAKIL